jgi:hypothetical protein
LEQFDNSVLKPREFFIDSETIGEGWGFRDIKQEHTRLYLLNKKTRCLCPVHNVLEAVTDFFLTKRGGNILQLSCGQRRGEAL